VKYLADLKIWIVTGTSGSDISMDDGKTWKQFDAASYNAISFAGKAVWAAGPKGAIARLLLSAVVARNRAPDFRFGIGSQFLEQR
jgi:hypothetical protein